MVDLSTLASGTTIVVAQLPLATLIPDEKRERINTKARTLANVAAQQKILDYLDRLAKTAGPGDGQGYATAQTRGLQWRHCARAGDVQGGMHFGS